ncbi:MAG: hypothetical protein V4555_08725, partial [Acidobacteriota bacterium]
IILVDPLAPVGGVPQYESVNLHVGGLALVGNLLYVADTNHGFRVFDLNNIRAVDGDSALCRNSDGSGIFGKVGTQWCADGYGYMLPEAGSYTTPTTKSDGTTIPTSCKPTFSFAGNDDRPATNQVLSGEYCDTSGTSCNGNTSSLNGRLYQWPIDSSTNHLLAADPINFPLYVSPTKVYYMNEGQVQGVASDNVTGAATDTYFLSSTYNSGEIYKVSPSATAKTWSYSASPKTSVYHPEGMYSTSSSSDHLWIVTEGDGGATTDPHTKGRVVLYIDQNAVN